jgi:hypothetical protein
LKFLCFLQLRCFGLLFFVFFQLGNCNRKAK